MTNTEIETKRGTTSQYFRNLFKSHPEWINERGNEKIFTQYRKDFKLTEQDPIPKNVAHNLNTIKTLLRKQTGSSVTFSNRTVLTNRSVLLNGSTNGHSNGTHFTGKKNSKTTSKKKPDGSLLFDRDSSNLSFELIPNSALANSAITINGKSVSLGGSITLGGLSTINIPSAVKTYLETARTALNNLEKMFS